MRECKVLVEKTDNRNLYRKYHTNQLLNGDSPRVSDVWYFYPGSVTIKSVPRINPSNGERLYTYIDYTEVQKKTNLAKKKRKKFIKSQQDDLPKIFKLAMKLLEIREITEISISNYMLGIQLANKLFNWNTVEPKVLLILHEVLEMPLMVRTTHGGVGSHKRVGSHKGVYSFEYNDVMLRNIQVPYAKWFYFPGTLIPDLEFVKIEDEDNDTDNQDTIFTNVIPRSISLRPSS